jgi:heat shock protein HslJ
MKYSLFIKKEQIMRKLAILSILIRALVRTACGGSEPTPVPEAAPTEPPPTVVVEPTEVPEEPPTAVPTREDVSQSGTPLDIMEHTVDPNLVNKTWAWEARDPNGNASDPIIVPNPENYTLIFNEDGTFGAKVDCNQANGRYASSGDGGIFMELGPMTMAACPEGSLSDSMIQMFGPAQDYSFEENGTLLKFSWAAGGPLDYFRLLDVENVDLPDAEEGEATGTVTAPDGIFLRTGPGTNYPYVGAAPFGETGTIIGVSKDGQWWVADAPSLPSGQVWVSAEYVEVENGENVPVVYAPALEATLTNTPWEWVSTTDPAQGTVAVNDPSRYVIVFNEDGTAYIKADCNNVQATYTADGSSISIVPGPSTMMACPEDTLDSTFLQQLGAAAIYFINGGSLYMDLPADSGTMRFVPQGTPIPSPDPEPPAGEADNSTLYLVSYGPQNAPISVIEGTSITASFAGDTISGFAGCNNYSGTLTPVDDHFTISGIITTRMFCEQPAGVMDQEQAYLAGLETVGGYQWEQSLVGGSTLVTQGQLFYTLPDGGVGVMNFVTSP